MQFSSVVLAVENYVRVRGAENKEIIKSLMNDAVAEFIRLDDWRDLVATVQFTTDDSDVYPLSTLITSGTDPYFQSEIELINESLVGSVVPVAQTQAFQIDPVQRKFDYKKYITSAQKGGLWALHNRSIYVTGTGETMTLFYLSPGVEYPLSADTDEPLVLQFYWDIIKQFTVYKFLIYIGDDKSAQAELNTFNFKLSELKKHEQRTRKQGKIPYISSQNR